MGFQHEREVSPCPSDLGDGMLAIDCGCQKRKIAIEFDGSFHYLKELKTGEFSLKENGATKAKRRWLERLGWTVINLDYRAYIKAKRRSVERQWLEYKLKEAGVVDIALS